MAAEGQAALRLQAAMQGTVRALEPLAPHTSIRIGGPAALFAVPASLADLALALRWASAEGLGWRVLGLGSNVLCPDEGFEGLVLNLERACGEWTVQGRRLRVGAGVHLAPLVAEAARRGLGGLQGLAGIPGTVGGALAMNAGTRAGQMADVVRTVWVMSPEGEVQRWPASEMAFGYRSSRLQQEPWIALAAELELQEADAAMLQQQLRESAAHRRRTQPLEWPNLGSMWQNPPGDFAGRLVEAAGCRGWRRGDAQVAPRHGNFIINVGRARAADVLSLMAAVRQAVAAASGVQLEPEIRWLPGQAALQALLGRLAEHPGEGAGG